jgi:6,7-dimethyl-8-ribityllumazine synthase
MVKWVNLALQARSEGDFELLTKLLAALGLRGRDIEEYPQSRWQTFLPSVAALEVVHRKVPREDADLELTISDPDSAAEVIKAVGLEILDDHSGPESKHSYRSFSVLLPGGTRISITGIRTQRYGFEPPGIEGKLDATEKKFAVVASRFNSFIVERLLSGTLDCLYRAGADGRDSIDIVRVPGSFEIPSAARTLAETGKYDAIICLGCLLRGDTAHYDVIVNEVTRGIGQSAQETGVPHAFGVLTCDTLDQAIDRAGLKMGNKGFEAALAAIEMANLKKALSTQHSAVSKSIVRRPSPVARKGESAVGPRPLVVSKTKTVARRASDVVRKKGNTTRKRRKR